MVVPWPLGSTSLPLPPSIALAVHDWLVKSVGDVELEALGLVRLPTGGRLALTVAGRPGSLHGIEVHSVRPARRIGSDFQTHGDLVIEITQGWHPDDLMLPVQRGGVTLLVDVETSTPRYFIRKHVASDSTYNTQIQFAEALADGSLAGNYFAADNEREPFALLHRERHFIKIDDLPALEAR
jgi:hypothetical protein